MCQNNVTTFLNVLHYYTTLVIYLQYDRYIIRIAQKNCENLFIIEVVVHLCFVHIINTFHLQLTVMDQTFSEKNNNY